MSRLQLGEGVRKVVVGGGKRERCVRAGVQDLAREAARTRMARMDPDDAGQEVEEAQGVRGSTPADGPGDRWGGLNVLCV